MTAGQLITVNDFCEYHHVEYTFIASLQDAGLVEITVINEITYVPESQLQKLEKMTRMYNELEINVPGIEAITYLLQRIEDLQNEMTELKSRL
jgi:chaperone modulatory protein CbpM